MKNIYEILEDFGLEIPAEKKTDFEKAWKENYRTKSEYDIAVTKRDEYKSSLDTVSEQLKAFDGVDVADLNGQIKKLKDDLKAKDGEYAAKEADRIFSDTLKEAIKTAGGRNEKTEIVNGGLNSADAYKIRIPYEKCENWISASEFRKSSGVSGKWTVQNGDFFMIGRWTGENVSGIDEIRKNAVGIVGKVLNHSENFFGGSKHIRIGGGS